MPSIELFGRTVEYRLRASNRAKTTFVHVKPDASIELVYPARRHPPDAETMLIRKADWVLRCLESVEERLRENPIRRYESGETLFYRGKPMRLVVSPSNPPTQMVALRKGDTFDLKVPERATQDDRRNIVIAWYRAHAKSYLPARAHELASLHGFRYQRLAIKHQKTRWGSCSTKGNINLNLRLMQTPDGAIDYVILHELCHLRDIDHSPAFWRHVAEVCPDYEHWEKWFDDNGHRMEL